MRKIFLSSIIFISLLGVSLIFYRLSLVIESNNPWALPEMPPNLNSQANPVNIAVSPPVPILMYHHIQNYPSGNDQSSSDMFVSPQNFDSQMQWLAANNFQTVDLSYFNNQIKLSKKPVVLTFDDGYQDAYTQAFPILKKYNFRATFYIIANDINKSGYLTKDEILEMMKYGMKFGSHSLSHPNLTTIPEEKAEQEIFGSKIILQRITGSIVSDFCYPGGTFNQNVENIVINSGYTTGTTTINNVNAGKTDPFRLNRLNIRNDTQFENLPALKNL